MTILNINILNKYGSRISNLSLGWVFIYLFAYFYILLFIIYYLLFIIYYLLFILYYLFFFIFYFLSNYNLLLN